MPKHVPKVVIPTNLLEFPAIKAWRELRPERVQPDKIEILKGREETARKRAYRLAGVGPEGSAVIAKRLRRAKALIEHTVYEEVIQYLPIPTLRCYGLVEEKDGEFCWLFLEDAGEERYSAFTEEHRRLAARWLGLLHTSAARVALAARLPDRGPRIFLESLRSARNRILGNLANPALNAGNHAELKATLSQCAVLESRWDRVERLCEGMPRAVVHGDFVEKNIRIRTNGAGITILPFDWLYWKSRPSRLLGGGARSLAEPRSSDHPAVGELSDHAPDHRCHQLERFKPRVRMGREAHHMDEAIQGNDGLCNASGRMDGLIFLLRRNHEEMLFMSTNLHPSGRRGYCAVHYDG